MRTYLAPILGSLVALCLFEAAGPAISAPPHGKPVQGAHRVDPTTVVDAQLKIALATAPKSTDFPDSDAVCLLDLSTVRIESNGTVIETIRKAYKLFNQRARRLAEVNLPFNEGRSLLNVLVARTIKVNGAIVSVKREDIRTSSPGQEYAMYGDAVSTGFSLPAIEDNCVIDYTYQNIRNPGKSPELYAATWVFTGPYPVKLSRLTIHAPAGTALHYKIYNDDLCKPAVTTTPDGKTKNYDFERRDIKPIVPEPMMPYPLNIASHMEVSTSESWDLVARWLSSMEQPRTRATSTIQATVAKLVAGKTTDSDKARAIYDWVVSNIRYVGVELGLTSYRPHPASEVYARRYGDAKDKANLLITMLGAAGIQADPVLLNAGNPINLEERLPSLRAFNHCIALARIEGKEVWLDATAETCPYGDIPQVDRGSYALVVAPGKHEFKQIPSYQPAENSIEDHETITVKEDGSAEIADRIVMRGSFAQGVRASMRAITPAQREQAAHQMIQGFGGGVALKDYSLPDGRDRTDHVDLNFTVTAPQYAQQAGELLLVPFATAVQPQNPFVQEKRIYPFVQPLALLISADVLVTIPKGYALDRMPANIALSSPLNQQSVNFAKAADGRSITVTAVTITKQAVAPVESFKQMQDYYKALLKLSTGKIVLKKIEP